jgi:hypothetical protein
VLFVGVFCGSDLFTGVCVCVSVCVCVCCTVHCIQLHTLVIPAYHIFLVSAFESAGCAFLMCCF